MAEQDRGGAVAFGDGVEGGVAGVPGGGFRSAVAAHGHGDGLDRGEAEFAQAQDDLVGAEVGAGLEAVVDGDAAGADAELGRFESEGRGERHGVGTAGACDEHERGGEPLGCAVRARADGLPGAVPGEAVVVVEDVVEDAADRQAYRRDRRMGTHVRFPS